MGFSSNPGPFVKQVWANMDTMVMNLVDDFGMRTTEIHYGDTILASILFFEGWGRGRHTLEAHGHGRIEPIKQKPEALIRSNFGSGQSFHLT